MSAECSDSGNYVFSAFQNAAEKGGPALVLGPGWELRKRQGGMASPGWAGAPSSSPVLSLAGGGRLCSAGCGDATLTSPCPHTPSLSPAWRQHRQRQCLQGGLLRGHQQVSPGGLGTAFLHSHSSHLCQQALISLRSGHKIRKLENAGKGLDCSF